MPDPCNTCASEETDEDCDKCLYGSGENMWSPNAEGIVGDQDCKDCGSKDKDGEEEPCSSCNQNTLESQWTPKDS